MSMRKQLPARNFVEPPKKTSLEKLPIQRTELIVNHPADQNVVVHTSVTDRAKGYQIVLTPLAIALGIVAVLTAVLLFNTPFLSFLAFFIFWITFCFVWLAGWVVTSLATPEFISWYSARRQWDYLDREQRFQFHYYTQQMRQSGLEDDEDDEDDDETIVIVENRRGVSPISILIVVGIVVVTILLIGQLMLG